MEALPARTEERHSRRADPRVRVEHRIYVAVYYKSWADMDASTAGIQKAVTSEAYQKLTKVTQAAVESSAWEINRLRPELSNPPDEVVAADPAFWKPKPAMAPKPAAPPAKQ